MPISQAKAYAKKALDYAWDGKFPVDPSKVAAGLVKKENGNQYKIQVTGLNSSDENLGTASGFAEFRHGSSDIFICAYNTAEPDYRRRFTIAHELGHVLLGHVSKGKKAKRDVNFNARGDWDEVDANAFAAELLMPEPHIREKVKSETNISTLAAYFGVSPTAIRNRLKNLGIL